MLDFKPLKEISPEAKLVLLLSRWIVHNEDYSDIENLLIRGGIEWERFKRFLF